MSDIIFDALAAPFPPDAISWRCGSMTKDKTKARALAYLDARDVMRRLDAVVGPGNWQTRYPHVGAITVCDIGIRIETGEWVWKANGAGHTDIEAEKGALSDAFKRAAVLWGIGQYLYDLDSPWVRINEWKQIADDELPRLRALLIGATPEPLKSARQARKDGDFERIVIMLRGCVNLQNLQATWLSEQACIRKMPYGWQEKLTEEKDRIKSELMARAA